MYLAIANAKYNLAKVIVCLKNNQCGLALKHFCREIAEKLQRNCRENIFAECGLGFTLYKQ